MTEKREVTFLISHPIQYFSPLFVEIANSDNIKNFEVLYFTDETINGALDKQFGIKVKWDIPLLQGYKYRFLKNNSWKPSMYNGFFGIINLELFSILRKKKRGGILIISGWRYFSSIYAILLGKLFGLKVCIRCDASLNQEILQGKLKLKLKKVVFWCLFKVSNKFLYIGEQNKLFYKFYGVREKDLIYTPFAVENKRFQKDYETHIKNKALIRTELQIPENKKVILYSGKYIYTKRPLDLLNAALTCKSQKDIFLIFMGEGELRLEMESFVQKNNMKNVLLTGFINQTELYKYFIAADLFVMCSGKEPWGLVVNEALNFGLPVIASDLAGAHADLVDPAVNGYVYPGGDIKALAACIDKIVCGDLPLEIAKNRSLQIIKEFSNEKILENLTPFFQNPHDDARQL